MIKAASNAGFGGWQDAKGIFEMKVRENPQNCTEEGGNEENDLS